MESRNRKMLRQIPNVLSLLRILCTLGLIFVQPLKYGFFILYSLCGLTDVLDGFLARRMNCCSSLGAMLDSIADLSFYSMMILKLFPVLWELLNGWVWLLGVAVVLIRLMAYGVAAWKYRRFASVHTYLNKATGLTVFAIPYFLIIWDANIICILACIVGGLASLEEAVLHLEAKEYGEKRKSIFMKPTA